MRLTGAYSFFAAAGEIAKPSQKVPALWPVLCGELPIGLGAQRALHFVADRKQIAELRANAGNAGLEIAQRCSFAAVARDLLEVVADRTDENVLVQELRDAPIDVAVDAVLVVGIGFSKL